jgi:hypothetical protein
MPRIKNEPMHAEVSSSDASSGAYLSVYPAGSYIGYSLSEDSGEFIVVTDIILSSANAGLVTLFCDTTDTPSTIGDGESIVSVTLPANGSIAVKLTVPYIGKIGGRLTLKAPAGQSNCQVQGYIKANPNTPSYATVTTLNMQT